MIHGIYIKAFAVLFLVKFILGLPAERTNYSDIASSVNYFKLNHWNNFQIDLKICSDRMRGEIERRKKNVCKHTAK